MTVFVATSKQFYAQARNLVIELETAGVAVYHPYFDLDQASVEADPAVKIDITRQHFPEIDASDIIYALLPNGYIGHSVTIELTYAYAKGKRVVASEPPSEFAVRAMVSEVCPPSEFAARYR